MSNTQQSQGVGSPISNEAYNVIAALQAKLEGMEAYRKYQQSGGNSQLWQQLNDLDMQAVQILTQEVQRLVQAGQVQLQQPGQTGSGAIQMGPAGSTG
jgi:hypothetical protein